MYRNKTGDENMESVISFLCDVAVMHTMLNGPCLKWRESTFAITLKMSLIVLLYVISSDKANTLLNPLRNMKYVSLDYYILGQRGSSVNCIISSLFHLGVEIRSPIYGYGTCMSSLFSMQFKAIQITEMCVLCFMHLS